MDTVRKAERREHDLLKGHKYTFLKNPTQLSEQRKRSFNPVCYQPLKK
jgi:hypothetical protein